MNQRLHHFYRYFYQCCYLCALFALCACSVGAMPPATPALLALSPRLRLPILIQRLPTTLLPPIRCRSLSLSRQKVRPTQHKAFASWVDASPAFSGPGQDCGPGHAYGQGQGCGPAPIHGRAHVCERAVPCGQQESLNRSLSLVLRSQVPFNTSTYSG